jgi:hypothetical protein
VALECGEHGTALGLESDAIATIMQLGYPRFDRLDGCRCLPVAESQADPAREVATQGVMLDDISAASAQLAMEFGDIGRGFAHRLVVCVAKVETTAFGQESRGVLVPMTHMDRPASECLHQRQVGRCAAADAANYNCVALVRSLRE